MLRGLPATNGTTNGTSRTAALWRLAVDRVYRNVMWLYLVRPTGSFQPFNDTLQDRYPHIFNFVSSTLGAERNLKILSFGCSTGDEVFSLRQYFPHADIKGVDINPANIAVCRRRLKRVPDAGISFLTACSTEAEPPSSYDAIFCMAVLRHGSLGLPDVTRCDHLICFADFARAVADFERCLKPGGLLIIRHSNFRLCDAPAGKAFETRV
jgi:SAM-dependent methyltransferase